MDHFQQPDLRWVVPVANNRGYSQLTASGSELSLPMATVLPPDLDRNRISVERQRALLNPFVGRDMRRCDSRSHTHDSLYLQHLSGIDAGNAAAVDAAGDVFANRARAIIEIRLIAVPLESAALERYGRPGPPDARHGNACLRQDNTAEGFSAIQPQLN